MSSLKDKLSADDRDKLRAHRVLAETAKAWDERDAECSFVPTRDPQFIPLKKLRKAKKV